MKKIIVLLAAVILVIAAIGGIGYFAATTKPAPASLNTPGNNTMTSNATTAAPISNTVSPTASPTITPSIVPTPIPTPSNYSPYQPTSPYEPIFPGLNQTHIYYFVSEDCRQQCTAMEPIIKQLQRDYNVSYVNIGDKEGAMLAVRYGVIMEPTTVVVGLYHSPVVLRGVVTYDDITNAIGSVIVE